MPRGLATEALEANHLIELLVVITIIAILIGPLLPAVQGVRDAAALARFRMFARRARCAA